MITLQSPNHLRAGNLSNQQILIHTRHNTISLRKFGTNRNNMLPVIVLTDRQAEGRARLMILGLLTLLI